MSFDNRMSSNGAPAEGLGIGLGSSHAEPLSRDSRREACWAQLRGGTCRLGFLSFSFLFFFVLLDIVNIRKPLAYS